MMKKVLLMLMVGGILAIFSNESSAQCGGSYMTDGDEIPCGDDNFPCCSVWNACNGVGYPGCNNYDPDYSATGGCDLSCTPIDSGVLFLLLGGAAFGGMMIMRRREHAAQIIR